MNKHEERLNRAHQLAEEALKEGMGMESMIEAWGELVKISVEILNKRSFQDGDPDDEVFRMWAIRICEAADRMKNTRPALTPNVPTEPGRYRMTVDMEIEGCSDGVNPFVWLHLGNLPFPLLIGSPAQLTAHFERIEEGNHD